MDPITLGLLIGGGGGLLKTMLFDKPAADRQRKIEAIKEKYSPWTGQTGDYVQDPSLGNGALQGAGTGASLGQGAQAAASNQALQNAQIKFFAGQGGSGAGNYAGTFSPWAMKDVLVG